MLKRNCRSKKCFEKEEEKEEEGEKEEREEGEEGEEEEEEEGLVMHKKKKKKLVVRFVIEEEEEEEEMKECFYITMTLVEVGVCYHMKEQSSCTHIQAFSLTIVDHTHTGKGSPITHHY